MWKIGIRLNVFAAPGAPPVDLELGPCYSSWRESTFPSGKTEVRGFVQARPMQNLGKWPCPVHQVDFASLLPTSSPVLQITLLVAPQFHVVPASRWHSRTSRC